LALTDQLHSLSPRAGRGNEVQPVANMARAANDDGNDDARGRIGLALKRATVRFSVQRGWSVSPKSDIDSLRRSSGRIALASVATAGFSILMPPLVANFAGNKNLPGILTLKTSADEPACRIFAGSARRVGDPAAPIQATLTIKLNKTVRAGTDV
jgi:hypothetical protein